MKNKKDSGSYYTPVRLAKIVTDYCLSQIEVRPNLTVLEPSVGDGSFVEAICSSEHLTEFAKVSLSIVEKDKVELAKAKAKNKRKDVSIRAIHADYLDFHFTDKKRYSLIIGNPPYIKKSRLTAEQIVICDKIHAVKNLATTSIKNIWTSFLVSALSKLSSDGIVAMVLPLELLQVKFTEELRQLLKRELGRVEVFTFDELLFDECKGQDTVVVVGYKNHVNPGVFYCKTGSIAEFENGNFEFYQHDLLVASDMKWTHHHLSQDDYRFLEELKNRLSKIGNYIESKPGVVTASNQFFIVNQDVAKQYRLQRYCKPIVQKGLFVNGSVTFDENNFAALVADKKPTYLLDFNNVNEKKVSPTLSTYLAIGLKNELPDGYKCKKRKAWYKIPNIANSPEAFFFKRAHDYPKLLLNETNALVTDSAYKIEMNDGYDLRSFIYSFYNSLTLVFAELNGRFYGGGVLELTPSEFKSLPVPYAVCTDFNAFTLDFENKESIADVLQRNNFAILNQTLQLTRHEIDRIETIRIDLVNKRQKNKNG